MTKPDDLVDRLRAAHQNSQQRVLGSNIFAEAADRIEALEAALRPFAAEAAKYDPDEGDGSALAWDSEFSYQELRAAHSALSERG